MNDDLISRAAAIDALKNERSDWNCDYNVPVDHCIDAIYSVPSAQPDVPDTNVGDMVSRAAAIDILDAYQVMVENGEENPYAWARLRMSELPPAQPERETAKFIRWMECKKTVNYISYTPHCKCSKCGTEFIIETIKYCYMCGARMER